MKMPRKTVFATALLLVGCAPRVVYRDAPQATEPYAVVTWRTLRFNSFTGEPVWSREQRQLDIKSADEAEAKLTEREKTAIQWKRTNFVMRVEVNQ